MNDSAAVQKIADLAVEAARANRLETHTPAVLHNGSPVSLETLQAGRSRFRGTYATNTLSEFVYYTASRANSLPPAQVPVSVFIAPEKGSATAFFNLGKVSNPGHADDRATLALRQTAAYAALLAVVGQKHTQRAIAEWLEDWFDLITPHHPETENCTMSMTVAIAAVRDITITVKGEQTSVQGDLQASRSALEEIEARSKKRLPSGFTFTTAPYDGFEPRAFSLRLAVLPQEKEPVLVLRIVGLADVQERIGEEFERKVRDGLSVANVYRGTFAP